LYTWENLAKKRVTSRRSFVDTGCIVGFTKDVDYDIESLAESKILFLGEGLFYATLRGPGTVYIQSLPSRLAENNRQHLKRAETAATKAVYWAD
jgi:uncharacterized protein (AIM24 family)